MILHKVKQDNKQHGNKQPRQAFRQASKPHQADKPTSEEQPPESPKKPSGKPTQAKRTTAKVKPHKQARGTNTSQTASEKPRIT